MPIEVHITHYRGCCWVNLQVPEAQKQLTSALAGLRHTFVVADATLPDCPLIYASEG